MNITDVNYATDTITVDTAQTLADNTDCWLVDFFGNKATDIGAIQ